MSRCHGSVHSSVWLRDSRIFLFFFFFFFYISCSSLSVGADVMEKNNDSDGGKERHSICSHISILRFDYPIASVPLRLLTCHICARVLAVHIQIGVCDTQPSITSLESFRSRCAPIHTLSHCFDFSKYKDVNHLPPLVRGGEFIHAGSRACLCMVSMHTRVQTHTHKLSINVLLPLSSISLLLSHHSPSAIPLFESNFMCQHGA